MKQTQYHKPLAVLGALGLSLAAANGQAISHVATTQLNTNGDTFDISVKDTFAGYRKSVALASATGAYGDGTLLDWRIETVVGTENPFQGNTVSKGPGTYFDTPVCPMSLGGTQNWLKVWTTSTLGTDPSPDITTGTVIGAGSTAVPLVGNIDISGLQNGQFYVVTGAFAQAVNINLTMTGPGQTPLTTSANIPSPGNQNRLHSVEFSFSNPGGAYYNIQYKVDNGGNTGRLRYGGVLLDGTLFVDTVEPAWVATWPNVSPVSSTLFTVNGNINENGTAYYVVLPDGASAPTSAQVKAGNNASDAPAPFSGNFALSALVPGSEMVTGLTASTAYDVYVVAEDVRGPNLQTTPVLVDVTTNPPDSTPPGWTATYPQQSRTPSGLTGIGNLDEPGNAYFVVLANGASAPTSAQVKAGNDASDTPAPGGSMSLLTSGVSGSDYVGGLIVGTTYDVWFAAEDLEGNLQASPQLVSSAPVAAADQFATGGFAWGTSSVWSSTTLGPYTDSWGDGNNAVFEGTAGVVAIASGTVVNDITFNSNNWTLQGGPLTLAGTAQPVINVNANTPRLENALAGTQGFTKTGSGVLRMVGTNSITGGFVIDAGWLGDNGGAPGTAALNNNDITANAGAVGLTCAGGTTTNGGITINNTTLKISNNNSSITVNGPVTGTGGIELSKTGDGSSTLNLLSTANTFTGGVNYTSNRNIFLTVNSFVDSASPGTGNIRLGNSATANTQTNRFALGSGATTSLTLTNRQFELATASPNISHEIYNDSAQDFTINSDLLVSGTGTRKFTLGGGGAGTSTFAGVISDSLDNSLALTKVGASTWVLSGDNTYTGATTVTGGTLALVGGSQASPITVNNGTKLGFTLGSPTTSTASVTLGGTSTITITGTPDGTSDYLLMTAASITGTPVLDASVGGYSIEVQGSGTQLVLVAPAPSATLVIDLGAGTVIEGGQFIGSGPTNLPLPSLPAGSILRSIAFNNVTLTATDNGTEGNYASDLTVLLDPSPGIPGGFSLGVTSSGANQTFGGLGQTLTWSTGNAGVGTSLTETKTYTDWAVTGDIDLATTGLFLGNAYQGTDWVSPQGGTWTGTITLNYDLVSTGSPYDTWAVVNAPPPQTPDGDFDGDGVPNAVEFVLGGDKDTNDLDRLPTVGTSGGNLTFSFERDQDSIDASVAVSIEVGTDLASWPDEYPVPDTATAGPPVAVVDNADGTDTVTLTVVQAPDAKKFARLKVVITP